MSELNPCPFCGGEAYMKTSSPSTANHNEGAVHFAVSCGEFNCGVLPVANLWQCTPEDAVKAWNNRPHENKIKAEAVREWADQAAPNNESEDRMVNNAYDYADKLEKGSL